MIRWSSKKHRQIPKLRTTSTDATDRVECAAGPQMSPPKCSSCAKPFLALPSPHSTQTLTHFQGMNPLHGEFHLGSVYTKKVIWEMFSDITSDSVMKPFYYVALCQKTLQREIILFHNHFSTCCLLGWKEMFTFHPSLPASLSLPSFFGGGGRNMRHNLTS